MSFAVIALGCFSGENSKPRIPDEKGDVGSVIGVLVALVRKDWSRCDVITTAPPEELIL